MKNTTITVRASDSVYFLTQYEYLTATQNGFWDHLGSEEIMSVEEECMVDWRKIWFDRWCELCMSPPIVLNGINKG